MDVGQPSTIYEIVADDLNKATHSSMDQKVLFIETTQMSSAYPWFSSLLLQIRMESSIRSMMAAVDTLLLEHPELQIELMQAWGA